MEIKSHATRKEFGNLNVIAEELHRRSNLNLGNEQMLVGMFCYASAASAKTVMQQFGFKYDSDIQGYLGYNANQDIYKEIDFLFSLNIGDTAQEPYMIIRGIDGSCTLLVDNPVIRYLLRLFRRT